MPEMQNRERRRAELTVAEVVDVDRSTYATLPPYDPTHEVRPPRGRGVRGSYRHAADIDALLAPYVDDALAGVPDRLLAERVGLSQQQVKLWRRRRHIPGRRRKTPAVVGTKFLLGHLLGEDTEPVPHSVSPVCGEWRPPAYVLRRPLDYSLFARMVSALVDVFTVEEIAGGIGIDGRDITNALALVDARGEP